MSYRHHHPYPPYIPHNATRLIVGTIPPPRFSSGGILHPADVDFCYGSNANLLWHIVEAVYGIQLQYNNSAQAVAERKDFLRQHRIGICDIVQSCLRQKKDASDLGMEEIVLRNILEQLDKHPALSTLLFMRGNSKNSPENLFRRQLQAAGLRLHPLAQKPVRKHFFIYKEREIITFSLISPSNAANRAIGMNPLYKMRKKTTPHYTTLDFRIELYRSVFIQRPKKSRG